MPMGRRNYSREFNTSAAALVQQLGHTAAQAATRWGVDPASLRGGALAKFPNRAQ
jgi:transposase-like protein